jgi:hypothetical protein
MIGKSKVMLLKLICFTCESWDNELEWESGSSTLQGELGARELWLCLCVAPLRLGGIWGKKSTPIIGQEVPMGSQ